MARESRGGFAGGTGHVGPLLVLIACLLGLTWLAHVQPTSLAVSHSLLLNLAITTAALLIAVGAAYFALTEFYLEGQMMSLLLGLAFLTLACASAGTGLLPVLAGWNRQALDAQTGWAFLRVVSAGMLALAAVLPRRQVARARRASLVVPGGVAAALLSGLTVVWVFAAPPASSTAIETSLQLFAGLLLFGAAVGFWRGSPAAGSTPFRWLSINFLIGGFAQLQYAEHSYSMSVVHAGDILRLVFFGGILLGMVLEWGRGYRTLRIQKRELEVLHALMAAPTLQDTADVIQHITQIVGQSLGSTARVVMTARQPGNGQVERLGDDEEISDMAMTETTLRDRDGLATPLEARGLRLGTLVVTRRADNPFSDDDVHLLRACASQACVLLDRSLLYQEVAAGAVLEERSRLAREIHDGLAQHLAFLKMRVAWLKRSPGGVTAEQLKDIEGMLGTALVEARQAISTLRSEPGTETAVDSIVSYAEDFGRMSGLEVCIEGRTEGAEVGPRARVEVLRIVQEALNNVRKHASANRVVVRIGRSTAGLEVRIRDDGKGFDQGAPEGHFGLQIMQERAQSIGATIAVESAPDEGTEVIVRVPPVGNETTQPRLTG